MSAVTASTQPATTWRPRWYREIGLLILLYVLYAVCRAVLPTDTSTAFENGRALLEWQQQWGVAPEMAMNKALLGLPALAIAADYFYATLHYLVTPAVLIWLYKRHPETYRGARRVLATATTAALVSFWLMPTAPPRMLDGFVDTMAAFSHWGWWGTAASAPEGLADMSNQFAAMPSLHVGWALWCGWMLATRAKARWIRMAGMAYPILTVLVVMATANHYLIDAVAGAAVVLAAGLPMLLFRTRKRTDSSHSAAAYC